METIIKNNCDTIEKVGCNVEQNKSMLEMNNLPLILVDNTCDKNCPYCIAKDNIFHGRYTVQDDKLSELSDNIGRLGARGIKFRQFILSGNGEPSKYSLQDLDLITSAIKDNIDMYDKIKVQTSGYIFYENEKLELMKQKFGKKMFVQIQKVSLNDEIDMKVLGYNKNYKQTDAFKKTDDITLDVALTRVLDVKEFIKELEPFVEKYPNITTIRFKTQLANVFDVYYKSDSPQAKWLNKYGLNIEEAPKFIDVVYNKYKNRVIGNTKLVTHTRVNNKIARDVCIVGGQYQEYLGCMTNCTMPLF